MSFSSAVNDIGIRRVIIGSDFLVSILMGICVFIYSVNDNVSQVIKVYYSIAGTLISVPVSMLGIVLAVVGIAYGLFSSETIGEIQKKKLHIQKSIPSFLEFFMCVQLTAILFLVTALLLNELSVNVATSITIGYRSVASAWLAISVAVVLYSILAIFSLISALIMLLRAKLEWLP